jgi:hypothetical protein
MIQAQTKMIEQHLLNGRSITPLQALQEYGCFRLGARIWDLRNSGHIIETELIKDGRKKFAKYYIKK